MYIYPDNLKSKAVLWLWELRDIGIIGVGGRPDLCVCHGPTWLPAPSGNHCGLCLPLDSAGGYQYLGLPALCNPIFPPGPADLCLGAV